MEQGTREIREDLETVRESAAVVVDLCEDVAVIALRGEHDMTTADELSSAIDAAAAQRHGVVVSLAETTFVDSAIVHRLYKGDRQMLAAGRRLVLHVGAEPVVDRVLEIGGLLEEMMWSVSLDDAIVFAAQSDGRDAPVDEDSLATPLFEQVANTVREVRERLSGS
jgi:anti-sigma B factor antagonist